MYFWCRCHITWLSFFEDRSEFQNIVKLTCILCYVKSWPVFYYKCQKLTCILISMSKGKTYFDNFLIDCDNFSARSIGRFMGFIWILNQRVILKCIRLKAGIHKWIQFSTFSIMIKLKAPMIMPDNQLFSCGHIYITWSKNLSIIKLSSSSFQPFLRLN